MTQPIVHFVGSIPLPDTETVFRTLTAATGPHLLMPCAVKASTEGEIDAAFASLVQLHAGALFVGDDPFFGSQREQLVALAARYRVPTVYPFREPVAAGGLISYGASNQAVNRQAGIYAGKILKGAKPADLPIQQPTKLELVVNLKSQGARPHRAAINPRPRRRGHRVAVQPIAGQRRSRPSANWAIRCANWAIRCEPGTRSTLDE
jgi:hypothetical protein